MVVQEKVSIHFTVSSVASNSANFFKKVTEFFSQIIMFQTCQGASDTVFSKGELSNVDVPLIGLKPSFCVDEDNVFHENNFLCQYKTMQI